MILTKMEQARTLSILTEQPHFINEDGKFVAFCGYVLTYSTFSTLFFWSLTGSNIYSKIWESDEERVAIVKNLNKHDKQLQTISAVSVKVYLTNKFKAVLKSLQPDEIDDLVVKMFAEI